MTKEWWMEVPDPGSAEERAAQLLASPVRRAIVEDLGDEEASASGRTAAELAERLELHTTTMRFHLDQLVAVGVLEARFVHGGGPGRPQKRFSLPASEQATTSHPGPAAPEPYALLAGVLAQAVAGGGEDSTPEEAGRRWARERAGVGAPDDRAAPTGTPAADPVEGVQSLLRGWGYRARSSSPEPDVHEIHLHDCPFAELAREHPDVVCGLHRGLLRGALDAVAVPEGAVELHPFVEPGICLARLDLRPPARRPAPQEEIR